MRFYVVDGLIRLLWNAGKGRNTVEFLEMNLPSLVLLHLWFHLQVLEIMQNMKCL